MEQQKLGFDDQYSCSLELEHSLDREYKDYYVIEIVARDGGNPSRSDKMTLQIKVRVILFYCFNYHVMFVLTQDAGYSAVLIS